MQTSNFDFNVNRGKRVTIKKTDNCIETGILLGLMPDDVIVLETEAINGQPRIIEVEYSEIKEVVENVEITPKYEFNGYFLQPSIAL